MWPVQSQEWEVKFFVPQATNSIWRRETRTPMLSLSVGVAKSGRVLTTAFTAADRSPKASRNDLVRSIGIDQKRSI